jgi:serum/glucocorticoid-regulated kinase 2
MDNTKTTIGTGTSTAVGVLTIRIFSGRNLSLPPGIALPESVKSAIAAASSNNSNRLGGHTKSASRSNRDSLRRERAGWWLPYVVLEFDKNEILVDALGGGVDNPQWLYKAHL